jgi:pimeloyl-ACP methyl ester carboxylesterase
MTSTQNSQNDFVISSDGTRIGYRQMGSGPGLILVHGGLMSSLNFIRLAGLLADEFTVYVPDRRGRGLSGPHGQYSLLKEAEDMQALVQKTQARNIFGLSSGAIVSLRTALLEPALQKVALYEPPIPVKGTKPAGWGAKYERALSKGNLGEAMIRIIRGTAEASWMTLLPVFISAGLMNMAIRSEAKTGKPEGEASLTTLIPSMHYDIITVHESGDLIEKSKSLDAEILLLGGKKSRYFLKAALDTLEAALPEARRITLPGVGHIAADNNGKPGMVADALRGFFREKK